MIKVRAPFIGACIALGIAACSGSFAQVREPFHASIVAGTSPRVTVTNIVGEVRVEPAGGNVVVVNATKDASNRTDLPNIEIFARRTADGVSIETVYRKQHAGGVRYDILVPQNASVQIVNTVGTIKVGAVGGSVTAKTETGTVEARLGSIGASRLVDLQSATGTIALHLAAGSSATITAATALGSISSDFSSIAEVRSNLVGASASGRIGTGAATVRLSVKTGSISIRRS